MRIFYSIFAALAAASSTQATEKFPPLKESPLDKAKVLAIARAAVAANETWIKRAEFEKPTLQSDGSWSVDVWRLPKTPGGYRVIIIDADGKLKDYHHGR